MRSPDPEFPVWIDGRWREPDDRASLPWSEGLLAGVGAFETIGVRDGACLDAAAHLARLVEGCAYLGVAPPPVGDLGEAAGRLASVLGSRPGWVRLSSHRDGPVLAVAGRIAPEEVGRASTAIVLPWRRHADDPLAGRKCASWASAEVGEVEARRRGADDGLWLNQRGHFVEACTANLFVVKGGRLFTPSTRDGALPGIVRGHVLAAAGDLSLTVHVGKVRRTRMRDASEAFLTSAVRGVRPLVAIDGRPVGRGVPGPVTRRIAEAVAARRGVANERSADGKRGTTMGKEERHDLERA